MHQCNLKDLLAWLNPCGLVNDIECKINIELSCHPLACGHILKSWVWHYDRSHLGILQLSPHSDQLDLGKTCIAMPLFWSDLTENPSHLVVRSWEPDSRAWHALSTFLLWMGPYFKKSTPFCIDRDLNVALKTMNSLGNCYKSHITTERDALIVVSLRIHPHQCDHITIGQACVLYSRDCEFFVKPLHDWNEPEDETRSSELASVCSLESHYVHAVPVLWTKIKRREKEIFVRSCDHRLHYRRYRTIVFHMTMPTVQNIYLYLIIYQTLIFCLHAHPCVKGHLRCWYLCYLGIWLKVTKK